MKKRIYFFCIFIFFNFSLFSQIQYSEEAQNLGLENTSYGTGLLGGGISFYDFDNDGWDDITVSSEEGSPVKFLKNNNGTFSEISLNISDELFETKTVQWVDFDNDGDNDLFVTRNTDSNRLYDNDGNMSFTDITDIAGLQIVDHFTFGASWGDYNNDGWLDLFINSRDEGNLAHNVLYKNNSNGTFTDVTADTGIILEAYMSFCAAFLDYNNDGWQDIYIANDKYDFQNLLYKNNGDGTFVEVSLEAGINVSIDAMSTTIDDYNTDGWLDIYTTNSFDGNVFFINNGDGTFTDIASSNGTLFESVAWGAVFLDAENDSDLDLYVSGMLDGSGGTLPSAFYENDGLGNYSIPLNAGFIQDTAISFSNAIGDIDNNGYPDITVLNYAPNDIFLWKNITATTNNWLKVKLQGTESNRQGIGSKIEISVNGEKQYNYTLLGEGYLGQNSAYEFFGIGNALSIDFIKVTWLSGIVDYIENPAINEHLTIIEGSFLSVNDNSLLINDVLIYPNPGKVFTISIDDSLLNSNLLVTDITGKLLLNNALNTENTVLDMIEFNPGVYLFTIKNGEFFVSKRVIIK